MQSPAEQSSRAHYPASPRSRATSHTQARQQAKRPDPGRAVQECVPAPSTAFTGRTLGSEDCEGNNPVTRLILAWWNRLMEGSWSHQEEAYPAQKAGKDYLWNTLGFASWGAVFPIFTIVATQLAGVEQAGMFSLAFVTASLFMILANYGVRVYQVSDLKEEHSFADYQIQRIITCLFMFIVGYAYCRIRGYEHLMLTISMGAYGYRMIDALADVYEGRLQQKDKLYLAGISQTIRSVAVLVVGSLALALVRDLGIASLVMFAVAAASFFFVTLPLTLFETPATSRPQMGSIVALSRECAPLFVALFLYALVDSMPKFAMEGVLSYDSQLYFNALYFPAQSILLTVGFIYKPLLVRMSAAWADTKKRRRFDLFIVAMFVLIIVITLLNVAFLGWIGIPIMSFLYGVDFSSYKELGFIMLAAGGVTGAIDFLYQVITILRKQKVVPKLYLITFGFSLLILLLLINITGLPGAVIGYLIVMTMLLVLLLWQYVTVRLEIAREPKERRPRARA